ncbi:MAG: DUF262 domain-containing protein [Lachnospiraceae bacterium]|nr:DUF262 domain-containing protein [Lachnospiraceae bacterium]
MAKKKIEKELTKEEKLQKEKKIGLSHIEREVPFLNTPSYFFNVGDKVSYGALKESVVEEVLYDGKVYVLRCIATNHNYGDPYDYEIYRVTSWVNVRPVGCSTNTNFAENQEVRLDYFNSTIESLLRRNYSFGIDFNPDYQRGYVWDQKDKEMLLDSIFKNIDIGKFVLIHLSDEEWHERGLSYEILDGKQRLSTLIEFYENKLSYKGKYFNDLSGMDKRAFTEHQVAVAEVRETDKKTVLKYFLMLNRTGKSMDEAHLEEVERMLSNIE